MMTDYAVHMFVNIGFIPNKNLNLKRVPPAPAAGRLGPPPGRRHVAHHAHRAPQGGLLTLHCLLIWLIFRLR